MKDEEILECCQSVYDFLTDDITEKEIKKYTSFHHIPKYDNMIKTINKYNLGDMISFTKMLNHQYMGSGLMLWEDSAREFFGTERGKNFYRLILRDLKLKQLNY